jgi:hypothetical protein
MLNVWGASVSAQSIYADIASEMAKEGINQAEAKLNQLPEMLRDGIDIATAEREFESDEYCLGNVQALINMGAVASNIMPFTKVWTYEDDRGPVGKLRVMLNGEKIHIEIYCDKNVLKSKTLPWGDGDKTLQEVNMSSVSALLGVGLNFQLQGIFDEAEIKQELNYPSLNPQLRDKDLIPEDSSVDNQNATGLLDNLTETIDTNRILTLTPEQEEDVGNIIRNQMRLCWNPPAGAENGLPQSIILGLKFDIEGRLIESPVNLTPDSGVGSLQAFEAARRAVIRCSPFDKLDPELYDGWKELNIKIKTKNLGR